MESRYSAAKRALVAAMMSSNAISSRFSGGRLAFRRSKGDFDVRTLGWRLKIRTYHKTLGKPWPGAQAATGIQHPGRIVPALPTWYTWRGRAAHRGLFSVGFLHWRGRDSCVTSRKAGRSKSFEAI